MHPLPPFLRFFPVWRRNFLVWRKLAIPSILGNLADPLIYMLGLGYGLGAMLPSIDGQSYVAFLAGGTVCASTMNAATFEALYSSFSRMHVQKTWDAILNTPLGLTDVVAGELFWAATKSFFSGCAILVVIAALGLTNGPLLFWVLPAVVLTGLAFAALGLIWNALAPSYDFFMYYFTLFITPMAMLSGVFFPVDQLPAGIQIVSHILPLTHATLLVRPLLLGEIPADIALHLAVLIAYGAVAFYAALILFRRRLLS
jgi:lipooligosaccharide transport system permease protein